MTGQQQLDLFGLCAYEENGQVVVVTRDATSVELDPYVARRFTFYLARAYHDALRAGRRGGPPTPAAEAEPVL